MRQAKTPVAKLAAKKKCSVKVVGEKHCTACKGKRQVRLVVSGEDILCRTLYFAEEKKTMNGIKAAQDML